MPPVMTFLESTRNAWGSAQVLAPLRAFLEIVLAYHEPTDEAEGVLSAFARKKSDDNTVYGVVAGYIHHHAIDAKHMDVSSMRRSFSQVLSSANLCDEENVALRLDRHSYDKEAHGGFKTEVPASLNVPLNERMSFIADKTNELVAQALQMLNLGLATLNKNSRYGAPTTAQKVEGHCVFDRHHHVRVLNRPNTFYLDPDGRPKVIPSNLEIRQFVYGHACDLNRVLHKMKRYGGTFSAKKLKLLAS
ncbi:hypothetical protein CNBB4750 [Cryptococcus deneoformans B-3501A]|uniref:hypothetical protein n=1 Tax=Cryptococcus deneoformans (strain B-3501A) TaxID=283643 RepID=UPI000042C185|nr:hypothetical protein CNBB4750 [Cryptococcus neoformans var. neoformans B-3501A]EAL22300.1 hypothetical protein CNBB4750 [Cryptococcus neoformans var. neoformans B-3501A]